MAPKLPPPPLTQALDKILARWCSDLYQQIKAGLIGGSSAWGAITGTLSDQTDLQTALDAKAPLASPALTGTPTAPTPAGGDNSTKIATTAFVDAAVASGSPVLSVAGKTGAVTLVEGDISGLTTDLAAKVPGTRTISTTAPLTGGGDLSANRTLAVSVATTSAVGVVKADGTTISVDGTGKISAVSPTGGPYDVFLSVPGYITRSINTVYQNTSGSPIIVTVNVGTVANNGTSIQALSDASNPPTTVVADVSGQDGSFALGAALVFVVQTNHYYKIPTSAGLSSISRIYEYQLAGSITDSGEIHASRAYNTVYQNTSGSVMWVAVQVSGNGGITNLLSDSFSPPTTQIWRQKTIGTASTMTVFAPVMDGHYYKLTNNGTGVINKWHEYTWNGVSGMRSLPLHTGNWARTVDATARDYRNSLGRSMWTIVCGTVGQLGTTLVGYDSVSAGRNYSSADLSSSLPMSPIFPNANPSAQSGHSGEDRCVFTGVRYDELYGVKTDNGSTSLTSWFEWFFS